nr:hypothetical protein [Tanacetum cinerariifolium]
TPQAPFINLEPGYSQEFNFPQDIHDFQQQCLCCDQCGGPRETFQCQQVIFYEPCCENCGGPHETFQCQPTNEEYYHEQNSCYNSNSFGFDHCQPPQYTVNHPIFNVHNDILTSQTTITEQMTTLTSMCEMVCQIFQKKQEEKRIKEEQAAKARYWKIPTCCDDDDDYNSAITPVLSTEEPVDSLSMRDEHLDTIPATESNEVIKSSVEDLVPIPSEFKGIPDTMCDVHLVNNPTPLEAKDHFEIVINSNDDISSSDDDSLYKENIEYVEASPYDSEVVSLEVAEIVIPEEEEIEDDNLREKLLNVPYVVWIFLVYLTYLVIPPYLHPFGNEDTIFDPGITINRVYSFKPGLSHRYGAFKKFNTHRSHLNECPMIINGKNIPFLDVPLFHVYPPLINSSMGELGQAK